MPAGRPTQYKPEYVEQARKLCELGAKDVELADFFGVSRNTLWRWTNAHPEFGDTIRIGKAAADARVERSLYEKATGYTFESVKIFQHQGEIIEAPFLEHVPPSDKAMIFWLKNRQPEKWRDVRNTEVEGDLTINLVNFGHDNDPK